MDIPIKGKRLYPSLDFHQTSDDLYPHPNRKGKPLNMDAHYYFYHFDYRNRGEPNFMKMYNNIRCNSMENLRPIKEDNRNSSLENSFDYSMGNNQNKILRSRQDRCNSVENEYSPKRKYFGNIDRKGGRQFLRSRSAVNLQTLN